MSETLSGSTIKESERWADELAEEELRHEKGVLLAEPLWSGGKQRNPGVKTHGLTNTKFYRRWRAMVRRCTCPKDNAFADYGGRGIRVCIRWLKFENFLEDMWPSFKPGLKLDRINNDGHYTPSNVRWATQKEENRNTRITTHLTFNGETKALGDWAEQYGIKTHTLHYRLRQGLSVEEALTKRVPPTRQNKSKYVNFNKQLSKWIVTVRRKYLGVFETESEAIKVRDEYERQHQNGASVSI